MDPNILRDPYKEFLEAEKLPVTEDFSVDLFEVDLAPWSRLGCRAGIVHLGASEYVSLAVQEFAPGSSSEPMRHLYEEVVYVLSGRGSTTITDPDGGRHSFEWGPQALFAIPLNAEFQHHNLSGTAPARLVSTVSLPLAMNTFRDPEFVYGIDYNFRDRFSEARYMQGEGRHLSEIDYHRNIWETNFVPDLTTFGELRPLESRGAGGSNIGFALANGTIHAHVSEIPIRRYKRAHRHGPDFHVFPIDGPGYSLMWFEGDEDFRRVNWRHGVVLAPQDQMFHQHFNTGAKPIRYLATAFGSYRFPFSGPQRDMMTSSNKTIADGGNMIRYEDQDPRVHAMFSSELAQSRLTPDMDNYHPRVD
ncbi:cupin domain-containing protein [Nocardioides sp. LHG3406-4]|uniref:cupin domain-containing protein n=1 Tax=Nocardioides sp. LHG3406-4 TaxID=2804575 RepID=UPI003CEF3F69